MRRFIDHIGVLLAAATLATACSGPITNSPLPKLSRVGSALGIDDGLREMKYNLEQAVQIAVLPADDPALGCVTQVMKDLGIDQPDAPVASFDPKTDTLLGKGSVLYIRMQQTQKLAGAGVNVPVSCEAFIGKVVIDVGRAGVKIQPGGGLLPSFR